MDTSANTQQSEDFFSTDEAFHRGESILEKPLLNTFFDPEEILLAIERTYKGYQKINGQWVYCNRPMARTVFINKTINMLRSVINTQNFNSRPTPKQIDNILLEKNIEYIDMCRNEPSWSLADEDVELAINIFDHVLQTFTGIIESGQGSKVILQLAAGVYDREAMASQKKEKSIFSPFNIFKR